MPADTVLTAHDVRQICTRARLDPPTEQREWTLEDLIEHASDELARHGKLFTADEADDYANEQGRDAFALPITRPIEPATRADGGPYWAESEILKNLHTTFGD